MRCILVALLAGTVAHKCVHNSLVEHHLRDISSQMYESHPFDAASRRLEAAVDAASAAIQVPSTPYTSLRITPVIDPASFAALSTDKSNLITNQLLPDAIAFWQNALKVIPINGTWYAQRQCTSMYTTSPPKCASVASNQMCLDQPIPASHFGARQVCSSCRTTSASSCTCSTLPAGAGVANTDYVLYVRAVQTTHCDTSVLAYATSCQLDQYDRPIMGMVNFCPNKLKTTASAYELQLDTAMHELAHALGMTAQMYAYMRNPDGTPRTARDPNTNQPAVLTNYACPNGVTATSVMLPAANTMQFFTERGHSVAKLVTPTVLAYAQSYFNCPSLNGVELENQDAGACFGSHWEERIFEPEMMSPLQSFRNVPSGLTLAYFQDSGWYQVNFSVALPMYWGARRGCGFAMDTCVTLSQSNGTSTPNVPDHYCVNDAIDACTVDLTARAFCTVSSTTGATIPAYDQYFTDTTRGGAAFPDYCPILSGYPQGDCRIGGNLQYPTGTTINLLGEVYGSSSFCLKSTLLSSNNAGWSYKGRTTGCYSATCANGVISITIAAPKGFQVVTCSQKGQAISVASFSGILYCPDPFVVCNTGQCTPACGANMICAGGTCECIDGYARPSAGATSCVSVCPNACSGNGVCNTATATCKCNAGYTGTSCSTAAATTTDSNDSTRQATHGMVLLLSLVAVLVQ
ncbi:leishmanolysin-like peptidase, metalloprotease family M08 [Achlya hypogyna]|uniref:Leishmanolysin-like peptidase, metalloprotease family M08 n=1 Tax=Achlya hypogyna TaxID=1202772 RepID=A0A1V9Z1G4_ACHHY|nr:leishmanolysin-like peptidase, metalloprotease family M08 [Achlya hypogyna]